MIGVSIIYGGIGYWVASHWAHHLMALHWGWERETLIACVLAGLWIHLHERQ